MADLLGNARHRASLCEALLRCFTFDRAAGPLLLFAGAADSGGSYGGARSALVAPAVAANATTRIAAEGQTTPLLGTASALTTGAPSSAAAGSERHETEPKSPMAACVVTSAGGTPLTASGVLAVLLPRMPAGLLYIASPRAYEALARVPRTVGRLAAEADAADPGVMRTCHDYICCSLLNSPTQAVSEHSAYDRSKTLCDARASTIPDSAVRVHRCSHTRVCLKSTCA